MMSFFRNYRACIYCNKMAITGIIIMLIILNKESYMTKSSNSLMIDVLFCFLCRLIFSMVFSRVQSARFKEINIKNHQILQIRSIAH